MGIDDIHVFINPDVRDTDYVNRQVQALQEKMMAEHRAGLHPVGRMRRECPFCQRL